MMAARNDEGLYAKARSLFISKATMDDFTGWATPRQADAVSSLFDTELANRERSKRERLLCLCSMVLRPVERLVFSPKER